MLNWWTMRAAYGFSEYEKDWYYGMTLLGDPLLTTQAFVPLRGDASGDGLVDVGDMGVLSAQWGTVGYEGDLNADGVVDVADLAIVAANWTGSGPGGQDGGATTVPLPPAGAAGAVLIAARLTTRRRS